MSEIQLREQTDVPQTQITQVALRELEEAAERAATPEEAQWVMHRAALVRQALERAKQPYEDCWRAGKTSVLAARKLGVLFTALSNKSGPPFGQHGGRLHSERGLARLELGLGQSAMAHLIRLARVPDAEFQRYIQSRDKVPSVTGALAACHIRKQSAVSGGAWTTQRRRRLGVKDARTPSLEEAGSLIVKALGHLGAVKAGGKKLQARSAAMNLLYEAHDLIRPYLDGYVE